MANFFDDTGIGTQDWDKHLSLLSEVLEAFEAHNVSLNPSKCKFGYPSARFLGFVCDREGLHPDPEKISVIQKWARPQSKKEISSFLGLVGFYRKMIPQFAELAVPLTEMMRKSTKFQWTDGAETSFAKLKTALSTMTTLAKPRFDRPWMVAVDASATCIGAVLQQGDEFGQLHPIQFLSRKLSKPEKNYSTMERELLALVCTLKKFRHLVQGQPIKLSTDHRPLLWLLSQDDLSGRLARWSTLVREYCLEVAYVKGKDNTVADALSRPPGDAGVIEARSTDDEFEVFNLTAGTWPDEVKRYMETGMFSENVGRIDRRRLCKKSRQFELKYGKLFFVTSQGMRLAYVSDASERRRIIMEAHGLGHFSSRKTAARVMCEFWWPKLYDECAGNSKQVSNMPKKSTAKCFGNSWEVRCYPTVRGPRC